MNLEKNYAYSLLTVKTIDEEKRIITGIATTPQTDLVDDIVEPKGAEFKLPIPFLWQHQSDKPVGNVTKARVTPSGIEVEVQLKKTDEPGGVKSRLDDAWQDIKLGLVRGLSIGFKGLETSQIEGTFGTRYLKWLWLELSGVTIAANQAANIQTVKSIDAQLLAATGHKPNGIDRTSAGASATSSTRVVKAKEAKHVMKKTFAEQISAYEATRAAKAARMEEIMSAAADKGETLDAEQTEEYDTLAAEVKAVDEHLVRLRAHEETNKKSAVAVEQIADPAAASRARAGITIVRQPTLPKGMAFVRMVGALAQAKGNRYEAADIAKQWKDSTPEVESVLRMPIDLIEKTAVSPGTTTGTTWAEPLVQYTNMAGEFIEYLRPLTIIGRIQGFRRVPFKIKVPRQTAGATVNWVGEAKVKPLSSLAFDSLTLDHYKIAGIIPLSEELVRFSTPSAETLVRDDLASAIVQFMDREFVDPTKALAAGVSPASITNGVTPTTATGTTAAAFRADVKTLMGSFLTAGVPVSTGVWLMTQAQALSLALMQNALGQPEFPNISMQGGTLLGFPVVVSENIPATGGSPADGSLIIFAVAGEIMLADDGGVNIDVSREASLQMETAPDSPAVAGTVLVSLWQHNMIAIKAERFINWLKRRSTAVAFIQNAKYAA